MKQQQNLQLHFPGGDNTVFCKHCKLNQACPLMQRYVPIVDIARLDGDWFAVRALCLVGADWDEEKEEILESVSEMFDNAKEVDNE